MKGLIIALVGPSGVGKGYAKNIIRKNFPDIKELFVYTTRKKRECDLKDRKFLSLATFLLKKSRNEIIGAHKPFGDNSDWYGFSKKQINGYLNKKEIIITELHLDNIILFKKLFKNRLYLISLVASLDYLKYNLKLRNSENRNIIAKRLDCARKEISLLYSYYNESLINRIFELNFDNRDDLEKNINTEIYNLIK